MVANKAGCVRKLNTHEIYGAAAKAQFLETRKLNVLHDSHPHPHVTLQSDLYTSSSNNDPMKLITIPDTRSLRPTDDRLYFAKEIRTKPVGYSIVSSPELHRYR